MGASTACNHCQKKGNPCSYRNGLLPLPSGTPAVDYVDPRGRPLIRMGAGGMSEFSRPGAQEIAPRPVPSRPSSPTSEPSGQANPGRVQSADPPSGVVHGVFAGEVTAALDAKMGRPSSKRTSIGLTPLKDAPLFDLHLDNRTSEHVDSNVLPRRRHADHLVNLFWRHLQPLEPILEEEAFYRSYEALFAGCALPENIDERVFLSILNTIFALATQLQEDRAADERNKASNAYFCRAWAILRPESIIWEPGSLEIVQCLLLMARYLQCSNNLHQTWMAVGVAVRIAQSIGLDRPAVAPDNKSPNRSRAAFRDQLWNLCVYMDR